MFERDPGLDLLNRFVRGRLTRRDAINEALTRFRWNRRKTAAFLKVSYKTLLNKMKECGIRGADLA